MNGSAPGGRSVSETREGIIKTYYEQGAFINDEATSLLYVSVMLHRRKPKQLRNHMRQLGGKPLRSIYYYLV